MRLCLFCIAAKAEDEEKELEVYMPQLQKQDLKGATARY